ncbi:hypothetical protein FOMPIDRAFT_1024077 [Fomitopsis schrenkii]|uniref:Uncharacterized protein n=1 Tax=Fomitopsis schrenkii TaxID=2126942 RepID=S8FNC1_FOMSC|nr:hypothetical protein FOMPIDRAFT_1024077 [Fomitopsis schrenkii]
MPLAPTSREFKSTFDLPASAVAPRGSVGALFAVRLSKHVSDVAGASSQSNLFAEFGDRARCGPSVECQTST